MKCRKVRWLSWRHTASKSLDFQLQSLFLTIVALPYCSFLVFKILFYFLTFRILVQFKWVCQVHFISFTAKPGGKDCFQFLCLLFVCEEQNIKVSAASNLLHIPLFFFFWSWWIWYPFTWLWAGSPWFCQFCKAWWLRGPLRSMWPEEGSMEKLKF